MTDYVYHIEQRNDEGDYDIEPIRIKRVYSSQRQAIEAAQKRHYEMCHEIDSAPEQLAPTKESVQAHELLPLLVLEPIVEGKRDPYMTYHIHQMKVVA